MNDNPCFHVSGGDRGPNVGGCSVANTGMNMPMGGVNRAFVIDGTGNPGSPRDASSVAGGVVSDNQGLVDDSTVGSIRVQVTTCGSRETESLSLDLTLVLNSKERINEEYFKPADLRYTTVLHIKENLVGKWGLPVDMQVLVCCGEVLENHLELKRIMEQLQQEPTLWLVFRDVCDMVQREERNPSTALPSIFALSGYSPGQINSPEQCIATFSAFCGIYGQARDEMELQTLSHDPGKTCLNFQSLTWMPSPVQKEALAGAHRALKNVGSSDFPQLMWYPDYGCAIMTTSTREGCLSLQVVFLC